MKTLFLKIHTAALLFLLVGCSSPPTRENNPDKFDLINAGLIKQTNIDNFKNCLIEGFEVKNRIAYNVKTKHHIRPDGHRVESYGGDVLLVLSVDILNSGKTQLFRAQNSALTDLSQQIGAFDKCLAKYE